MSHQYGAENKDPHESWLTRHTGLNSRNEHCTYPKGGGHEQILKQSQNTSKYRKTQSRTLVSVCLCKQFEGKYIPKRGQRLRDKGQIIENFLFYICYTFALIQCLTMINYN